MRYLLYPLLFLSGVFTVAAQEVRLEIYSLIGFGIPSIVHTTDVRPSVKIDPAFMPGLDVNIPVSGDRLDISAGFRGSMYGCSYRPNTRYSYNVDFVSTVGFPLKLVYKVPVGEASACRLWMGTQPYFGVQYPDSRLQTTLEAGMNMSFPILSVGVAWIRPLHNYRVLNSSLRYQFIMFDIKFRLPNPPPPPLPGRRM